MRIILESMSDARWEIRTNYTRIGTNKDDAQNIFITNLDLSVPEEYYKSKIGSNKISE